MSVDRPQHRGVSAAGNVFSLSPRKITKPRPSDHLQPPAERPGLAVVVEPVNRSGHRDEHILSHQRRIRILQPRLPGVPIDQRRIKAGKFRPRQLIAVVANADQQGGSRGFDCVSLRLAPQSVRIRVAGTFSSFRDFENLIVRSRQADREAELVQTSERGSDDYELTLLNRRGVDDAQPGDG